MLGLGFSPDETKDILWSLDFNMFMDDSWGIVRDTDRLVKDFGWYKGDFFREWIAKLIRGKTGNSESTFADIDAMMDKKGFRSLYFMGTNLSTAFSEVFSGEHTPRVCAADAVRISMSIPLFLRPSEARAAMSMLMAGFWITIRLNYSTGKSISIPAITPKPTITGK